MTRHKLWKLDDIQQWLRYSEYNILRLYVNQASTHFFGPPTVCEYVTNSNLVEKWSNNQQTIRFTKLLIFDMLPTTAGYVAWVKNNGSKVEVQKEWIASVWSDLRAGPWMPTTKNIERQMVSVGDQISQKNATSGLTWDRIPSKTK